MGKQSPLVDILAMNDIRKQWYLCGEWQIIAYLGFLLILGPQYYILLPINEGPNKKEGVLLASTIRMPFKLDTLYPFWYWTSP